MPIDGGSDQWRILDESTLHGVHNGLEAIVRAQFFVNAMEVIPERGERDSQLPSNLGRVLGLCEQVQDSLLLF